MGMFACRICGKENPEHFFHCEEHYKCEDCGTKEKLCSYTEALLCLPCHEKRVERRIAEFSGDTDYTDEVVCPHCGYKYHDSWELSDGEYECSDCGRRFNITRDIEVTYSTDKIA
jgi:predicted RNA-binding Zn-ribbon protein involved in translation (DUF1610 family)